MVNSFKDYNRNSHIDYWLLIAVLGLSIIGLIMVFSSSAILAKQNYNNKLYFFERQLIFFFIGIIIMLISLKIPVKFWIKFKYVFVSIGICLLALTVCSPLGIEAGNAKRWLDFKFFTFQPLEIVKVFLVFYLAYFYANKQDKIQSFGIGILPPLVITLFLSALLILQPDLGGAAFLLLLFLSVAFVGGVPLGKLFGLGIAGIGGLLFFIFSASYRIKRVEAFLHPFSDPGDKGYQLVQSFYGLANGGLLGVGLGEGKQKFFYLPEAHNDFILSILGEEMGFIGLSIVFLLVLILFWRWLKIVLSQEDLENKLLAFGLGLILLVGMFLNMGVVLGVLPPKGVTMPFVSYGGSSLLSSFLCVGILLKLERKG
ncbi:cell division protein FtsW [Desulfonauticus submarinus]|uniref:Probable peptidoglycan glycosyltransferase FtsW n=1 Tax=Desulfonauticus submarinus TaxID=206665 RepID=A0A1H0CTV1_9BACT|nr:putative lipid II flippase FtsW [Desulfonauticus submarinus]SDN61304.1 cell division protein FtsW [Desulfonauticus submarinus]